MSLFCLNLCYYPLMFVCYFVFKAYVIEKICSSVIPSKNHVTIPYVRMLLCLQNLCSSVSYKIPTPIRLGWGCRLLPNLRSTSFFFLFLFFLFIIFLLFFFLPQRFVRIRTQLALQFCSWSEDHTRLNCLGLKSFFRF